MLFLVKADMVNIGLGEALWVAVGGYLVVFIGLILLMGLMLVITYQDIVRLITG